MNSKTKNQIAPCLLFQKLLVTGAAACFLSLTLTAGGAGLVAGWGYDANGGGNVPTNLNAVIAIAAGGGHSLALKPDRTVAVWGQALDGESDVLPTLNGVVALAAGVYHSMALRSNGTVVAWGANTRGQTNVPATLSNAIAISAGGYQSLALKADGTVVAWGQIYNGTTFEPDTPPAGLSNVIAIASGGASRGHSLALKSDGTVVAWGSNSDGQTNVPATLSNVIAIAAGGYHSLALKSDGTIIGWGRNFDGQATALANLSNVMAIAAGELHSVALKANGTVTAWGWNAYGQANVPANLSNAVAIAAGQAHSLAMYVQPPQLLTQPSSQTVVRGTTVNFSVTATGLAPLGYQWFFNVTNVIGGATSTALQLTNVQTAQAGAYSVVVTNPFGAVTSAPAILTVVTAPLITASPTDLTVAIDDPVDFTVSAMGVSPLAYQWFFNGTDTLAGATSSLLHFDHVQFAQSGNYSVIVTNSYGAATSAPASLTVMPRGGVVTNCTETALRAAMTFGGTVTFACDGTITLTNTLTNNLNTIFDASGHQLTISGGNNVGVFYVRSNVTVTLINLTVADGRGIKGAGVLNDGGTLNLNGVAFLRNRVTGAQRIGSGLYPYGAAEGGAIFNQAGFVSAISCAFSNNSALQPSSWPPTGPPAQPPYYLQAFGGAICNAGGSVNLQDCVLAGNTASGTPGVYGALYDQEWLNWLRGLDGVGGAIYNSGALTVLRCSFLNNAATGGAGGWYYRTSQTQPTPPGGLGGSATGGAICNQGTLSIASSAFADNNVTGGAGGAGAPGYRDQFFSNRTPGGPAGAGGNASASAVWGALSAVNTTFAWNTSQAGSGGGGGSGVDAYYNNTSGTDGGAGGNGGSALGAISGAVSLTNCSLAYNSAIFGSAGAGGTGGAGRGIGANGATGPNGSAGTAGGGGLNGGGSCLNTLLATNQPGGNNAGALTDRGHNISSDATCAFTGAGSLNNTDPKLAPLADNGGPTLTMALLPGSPAIDAGDTTASPAVDQRGFPRPFALAADIGAYEYTTSLRIVRGGEGGIDLVVHEGMVGQSCRLLAGATFSDWQCVATNQIGLDGTTMFHDNFSSGESLRFYKVVSP